MKLKLFAILMMFVLPVFLRAQSPTPPDPLENAWAVNIQGGYSYTTGNTNNGVLASAALRIAQHWDIRNDFFSVASTPVFVNLAKIEYRPSLAHALQSNAFINVQNLMPFINVGAGVARDAASVSKFAYSVGGGIDVYVSPTVTVRPLDVTWVRGALFNGVVGNHIQLAASVGFTFGGNKTLNAAFKRSLAQRGKR